MKTIQFSSGSKKVIATRNDGRSQWSARLYVNNGETATQVARKFWTESGVEKWAKEILK